MSSPIPIASVSPPPTYSPEEYLCGGTDNFSEFCGETSTSGYLGDSEWGGSPSSFYPDHPLDSVCNPSEGSFGASSFDQNSVTGDPETPSSFSSNFEFLASYTQPLETNVCVLSPSLIDEFKIFIGSDIENETSRWEAFFYDQSLKLSNSENLLALLDVYYNLWLGHFDFFIIDYNLANENIFSMSEEQPYNFTSTQNKLFKLRFPLGVFFKEQLYLLSTKNIQADHLLRLSYNRFLNCSQMYELFSQDIFILMTDPRLQSRSQFIFIWEIFLANLSTFEKFVTNPKLPIHAFALSDQIKLTLSNDTALQQEALEKLKDMIVKLNSNQYVQ
jgi:hypothetical protein